MIAFLIWFGVVLGVVLGVVNWCVTIANEIRRHRQRKRRERDHYALVAREYRRSIEQRDRDAKWHARLQEAS